jgi:hypothetical protein
MYNFTQLLENVQAAKSRGWSVGIRLITSKDSSAPLYLGATARNGSAGYNLTLHDTHGANVNYDPADPIFHARYLAMVAALGNTGLCQDPGVKLMYVGYASPAWGDEGIGPHHGSDPDQYPHVVQRLNRWRAACSGQEWKMIMGGVSAYGLSLGFGTRNGFVEHYWYRLPDPAIGQTINAQGYIEVNESAEVLERRVALGDEAEEYEENWASEYRTSDPGQRGGRRNLSAPMQGGVARFGPLASFTYRFLMASLRSLQMRVSTLLLNGYAMIDPPSINTFMALELGRTASDTPDAWCFLVETRFHSTGGGPVKNWERWLYQRDDASPSARSVREAKITQTPATPSSRTWATSEKYDYIARAAESGKMSFRLDSNFLSASPQTYVVKITFFDVVGEGSIHVTNSDGESLGADPQQTTGNQALKTATFVLGASLDAAHDTFNVRGFDAQGQPQEIVLSFVRVIKIF